MTIVPLEFPKKMKKYANYKTLYQLIKKSDEVKHSNLYSIRLFHRNKTIHNKNLVHTGIVSKHGASEFFTLHINV